ncbi:MAG: leucine-rich repeat domain-containing protein [Spirochaetaceae bacterium]|nr:leucine-rich repeat domain-containing protein [Spirochaetaceae bacterium]
MRLVKSIVFFVMLGVSTAAFGDTFGDFEYETSGRSVAITRYRGSASHLAIPDRINGMPVASIGDRSFSERNSLISVVIPDSVTYIGKMAFLWCSNLYSVTVPSSVIYIGDLAFYGCGKLAGVTIPNSVAYIGEGAFYLCGGLISVFIPSSVTSIGNAAFGACVGLMNITVDEQNPKYSSYTGVLFDKRIQTIIQYPARKSGSSYTIPASVVSIAYAAFSECSNLTSVTIPGSVAFIGDWAFYGCSNLTSVTIPGSVDSIGDWAFYGCSRLISVTLSRRTAVRGDSFPDGLRIMYRN